jgi:hypothetical protein
MSFSSDKNFPFGATPVPHKPQDIRVSWAMSEAEGEKLGSYLIRFGHGRGWSSVDPRQMTSTWVCFRSMLTFQGKSFLYRGSTM